MKYKLLEQCYAELCCAFFLVVQNNRHIFKFSYSHILEDTKRDFSTLPPTFSLNLNIFSIEAHCYGGLI